MQNMIKKYRFSEISKIPKEPGLYVWYAAIELGEADISDKEQLVRALNKQSSVLLGQRMEVSAKLDFSLEWNGMLCENAPRRERKHLLSNALSRAGLQTIAEILTATAPIFFRPLYIGKTKRGLRARIQEHINAFYELKELHNESEIETDDQFAARAVKAGFKEDQLVCYVYPILTRSHLEDGELDRVLLAAESFLNEWATPILGRN